MRPRLRASIAAVALSACGGRVASEPLGGAGNERGHAGAQSEGGAPGAGGDATGGSPGDWLAADAETFCAHLCTPERIDDVCLGQTACRVGQCVAHAEDGNLEVRDAYRRCVEQDPLCFQSVEACILDRMWPPDSALRTFELRMTGLPPHMDLTVQAGAVEAPRGQPLLGEAVTSNGDVLLVWEWPWPGDLGPVFYAWADVDGDGLCESNQDLFGITWAKWNGSFEEPGYAGVIAEFDHNGAGACSVLGMMDVGR